MELPFHQHSTNTGSNLKAALPRNDVPITGPSIICCKTTIYDNGKTHVLHAALIHAAKRSFAQYATANNIVRPTSTLVSLPPPPLSTTPFSTPWFLVETLGIEEIPGPNPGTDRVPGFHQIPGDSPAFLQPRTAHQASPPHTHTHTHTHIKCATVVSRAGWASARGHAAAPHISLWRRQARC